MEQRRVRLGDIVDDYCPRERRLTNHAVVAMIDDEIKQTRCTTCEADHVYKGAKIPARRKPRQAPAALFPQAPSAIAEPDDEVAEPPVSAHLVAKAEAPSEPVAPASAEPEAEAEETAATPELGDEGPVHRPLIRATLPRPVGELPERKPTDFTLRQPGARLGPFREIRDFEINGNRAPANRPPNKPGRPGKGGGRGKGKPKGPGGRPGMFADGPSHGHRPPGPGQGQPPGQGRGRGRRPRGKR